MFLDTPYINVVRNNHRSFTVNGRLQIFAYDFILFPSNYVILSLPFNFEGRNDCELFFFLVCVWSVLELNHRYLYFHLWVCILPRLFRTFFSELFFPRLSKGSEM